MPQSEQQEQRELLQLVGEISLSWSSLEDDLALLLSCIIQNKNEKLVGAIFHATTNFDVKLIMIDEAFKVIAPALPQTEVVSKAWERLRDRIRDQKTTRNAAIHGSFIVAYGKLCLGPPTFSPKFWREASRKKQRIGVSANEIHQAINSIEEIRKGVRLIATLISLWYEENMTTYAEKLPTL